MKLLLPPLALEREGRVLLLAEVAHALLDGKMPSRQAQLFVGSALTAWLETGGAFEKHARVGAPRGSHHKPNVLYRFIVDEGRNKENELRSAIATDEDRNQ